MSDYMFMSQQDGLSTYKHIWTRNKVKIGEKGDVQEGELDINYYSF
jgi:hypothetical protein